MKIKWKKSDGAVSEVIGAILMVGIGVALFSILYFIVMSYPFTPSVPSVDIVGSIEGSNIVLEHRGGDSLDQNATVSFIVGGIRISDTVGFFLNDTNGNNRWDIGEQLVYNYTVSGNITGLQVEATVVDRDSNSIMMMGVLQEGIVRGGSPPVFGTPSPTNGSTGSLLSFSWSISINDPDGNVFSWTIQCNNGQTSSGIGASNGTKSLALSGLVYSTSYKVWVNATDPDGSGLYTRRWYTFSTSSQPWSNRAPTFSSPSPVNGSTSVNRFHATNVTVSDLDGNSTTVCFWYSTTAISGPWTKAQQNNSVVANTTVKDINSSYSSGWNTQYWWKVTAFDGHVNSSVIYSFTTRSQPWSNRAPTFSSPSPVNGSTSVNRYHATNVTVSDLDGNSTTVCFWYSTAAISGPWTKAQQNNSVVANTTVKDINSSYSSGWNTQYWWKVTAYDGHVNSSVIYTFTTKTNTNIINLKPNLAYDNSSGSEHKLTAVELTSLNFSDDNRYTSYGSWGSTFAKRIEFNFPNISSGATVLNVTLNFEWARFGAQVDGARLGIWDGSIWTYYPLTLGTGDVLVIKYLSGIINTAAKVNSLKLVFQATSSPAKTTSHDWVQVDVTYT